MTGTAPDIAAMHQDTIDDLIATVQAKGDVIARLPQDLQHPHLRVAASENRPAPDPA